MAHTEVRCSPRTMISANAQPASLTGPTLAHPPRAARIEPPSTTRRTPLLPSQAVPGAQCGQPGLCPRDPRGAHRLTAPTLPVLAVGTSPRPAYPANHDSAVLETGLNGAERRPRGRRRVRNREPYFITPRAADYDPKCLPPYSRLGGRPHVALASGAPHSRHSCKTPLSAIPIAHAD